MGTRTVVLVNSRKERFVAAALCYLTALPAIILLGLYCRDSGAREKERERRGKIEINLVHTYTH